MSFNRGIFAAIAAMAASAGMFPYAGRSVYGMRYQAGVGVDAKPKTKSQRQKRAKERRANKAKNKQNFHKRC